MIYTLNLDSENYFSSETGNANRGHRVYAVDWSFLPENTAFKMTFRFQGLQRAGMTNGLNNIILVCNLGTNMQNYIAGNSVIKINTNILGNVSVSRMPDQSATGDGCIDIKPHHNPPIFIQNRPTGNVVEVDARLFLTGNRSGAFTNIPYNMTLYFEEVQ